MATLVITQHRSSNGANERQIGTLKSLGLGRIGRRTERPDDPTLRGALRAVAHLVRVEERA